MKKPINLEKTLEIIERMKIAKIGDYKKWEIIIKKINKKQGLNPEELEYYSNLTRIYKESAVTKAPKEDEGFKASRLKEFKIEEFSNSTEF